MGRTLTPSQAAAALRRGVEIEQFINLDSGEVRYLTSSRAGSGYALSQHRVHDDGTPDRVDITVFRPLDADEEPKEGRTVATFATAERAVEAAQTCGGSQDRWVDQGRSGDDYRAAHRASARARRSATSVLSG